MVISSLVVETHSLATAHEVAQALAAFDGVEIHEIQGYKIVVTIEAPSIDESHRIASSFIGINDVANINLVYVNTSVEDDEESFVG